MYFVYSLGLPFKSSENEKPVLKVYIISKLHKKFNAIIGITIKLLHKINLILIEIYITFDYILNFVCQFNLMLLFGLT